MFDRSQARCTGMVGLAADNSTVCNIEFITTQRAHSPTLKLNFTCGSRFCIPGAAYRLLCPVHETVEMAGGYLDFFQYRTELQPGDFTFELLESSAVLALCRAHGDVLTLQHNCWSSVLG
jgi:hypothetical protein